MPTAYTEPHPPTLNFLLTSPSFVMVVYIILPLYPYLVIYVIYVHVFRYSFV